MGRSAAIGDFEQKQIHHFEAMKLSEQLQACSSWLLHK
jgi:hypothetical protein